LSVAQCVRCVSAGHTHCDTDAHQIDSPIVAIKASCALCVVGVTQLNDTGSYLAVGGGRGRTVKYIPRFCALLTLLRPYRSTTMGVRT